MCLAAPTGHQAKIRYDPCAVPRVVHLALSWNIHPNLKPRAHVTLWCATALCMLNATAAADPLHAWYGTINTTPTVAPIRMSIIEPCCSLALLRFYGWA